MLVVPHDKLEKARAIPEVEGLEILYDPSKTDQQFVRTPLDLASGQAGPGPLHNISSVQNCSSGSHRYQLRIDRSALRMSS